MVKEDRTWLFRTVLAIIVVVALTMILLRVTGMIGSVSQESGASLAAILTFLGVMITASVSMIGFLINRQSERRLEAGHRDERERLRLDAAMRAGSLFNGTTGEPANHASVASGLLALTQLDRADLAVALLVDLWSSDEPNRVSTETAILVLNAALASSDPNSQLIAAELLCRNSARLDVCQSLHWPRSIDGRWKGEFGLKTKLLLVDALVRMTYTSEPNENALRSVAVRLYGIWSNDLNERVRGCMGRLIEALIPALERLGYGEFMQDPQPVTLEQMKKAASSAMLNPDGLLEQIVTDRREKLSEWSRDCRIARLSPGSLASTVMADIHSSRFAIEEDGTRR